MKFANRSSVQRCLILFASLALFAVTASSAIAVSADTDGDGVADSADACPNTPGNKPNGCMPEQIFNDIAPAITGDALLGATLSTTQGQWSINPDDPTVADPTYAVSWLRCNAAGVGCATIDGATANDYLLTIADVGSTIRSRVTATSSDTSAFVDSDATAVVDQDSDGDGLLDSIDACPNEAGSLPNGCNPIIQPPFEQPKHNPAIDPLSLAIKTSLGSAKMGRKGTPTLKSALVTCGASATGPCTGTAKLSIKIKKKTIQMGSSAIIMPAGTTGPIMLKLSKSAQNRIKKTKRLRATLTVSVAAPGFAPQTAVASITLKK